MPEAAVTTEVAPSPEAPQTQSGHISVKTNDGYTVTSTKETADAIKSNLNDPEPLSKAASELGKKGAEVRHAKVAKAEPSGADGEGETGDSDDDGVSDDAKTEKDDRPLGKPRHDPRARMFEATRKEAEAKRARDLAESKAVAAEAKAAALEARIAAGVKTDPEPKVTNAPPDPNRPKVADYAEYEDYVDAVADYRADQKLKAFQEQQFHQQRAKEYGNWLKSTFDKAAEAFVAAERADPAFRQSISDEVKALWTNTTAHVKDGQGYGPENVIADELIMAASPPLALYLSEHPEELQRLRTLRTPQEIQVDMRVLVKTLTAEPPKVAVTAGAAPTGAVSRARPPVRPVTGSPHTADSMPPPDAPYDEHRRYWNAKEGRAR